MGHWGKVVGGAVGAMVGGPLGAAFGVGLGSMFDTDEEAPALEMPGFVESVTFEDDPDGRVFLVRGRAGHGDLLVVRVLDAGGTRYLRARTEDWADRDGDFVTAAEFADGSAAFYVPAGAVDGTTGLNDVVLELQLLRGPPDARELHGSDRFTGELPIAARWSAAVHWRPLIGLCMTVARADGQLLPEEVRAVRGVVMDGLGLDAGESAQLQRLMKEEPSASVHDLMGWMFCRFPAVPWDGVLTALADVARSDGHVHGSEIEVIQGVAAAYGVDTDAWPGIAAELGLRATVDLHHEYYRLLELNPGASRAQIKKAYRVKVGQYHPDRVANLAPEFRELAKNKTMELRVAYEALLEISG